MDLTTALREFLLVQQRFTLDELRRWLSSMSEGKKLLDTLPASVADTTQLCNAVVELMSRNGILLNESIWDHLAEMRPGFLPEIEGLKALYLPGTRPIQFGIKPSHSSPQPTEKLKILLVSASPDLEVRRRVDKEFSDIIAQLRAAKYHDRIELIQVQAVTFPGLRTALLLHEPHILHLSYKGEVGGDLLLEQPKPKEGGQRIPMRYMLALLSALRGNLRMVFLNGGHSEALAKHIPPIIDLAIGMRDAISDEAAVAAAVAFYEVLAFGRSCETAFATALAFLGPLAEDGIPALFPPAESDAGGKRVQRFL